MFLPNFIRARDWAERIMQSLFDYAARQRG
jgi:hypothetical protein